MNSTKVEVPLSQVLFRSAEAVRILGLAKHTRHSLGAFDGFKAGAVCALGAIEVALGLTDFSLGDNKHPAILALAHHLPPAVPNKTDLSEYYNEVCTVTTWNNAPSRVAEEVIAMFEAAAHCEANKEAAALAK